MGAAHSRWKPSTDSPPDWIAPESCLATQMAAQTEMARRAQAWGGDAGGDAHGGEAGEDGKEGGAEDQPEEEGKRPFKEAVDGGQAARSSLESDG